MKNDTCRFYQKPPKHNDHDVERLNEGNNNTTSCEDIKVAHSQVV